MKALCLGLIVEWKVADRCNRRKVEERYKRDGLEGKRVEEESAELVWKFGSKRVFGVKS